LPSSLDHQVQQTAVRLLDAFGLGELLDEALGFLDTFEAGDDPFAGDGADEGDEDDASRP